MATTERYEYGEDHRGTLMYHDAVIEVDKPTWYYGDEMDHAALTVISAMRSTFPTAYADENSGHTSGLIERELDRLDLAEYGRELKDALCFDGVDLYTGKAWLESQLDPGASVDRIQGFIKINKKPRELQEELGSVVEVAELVTEGASSRLHLGSALLFTAMRPLAEGKDPEIVGRIPGFCERSIRLATEGLGMTVVKQDVGILFPHNRPVVGKIMKAIGRPLVRPVQWDVYGGVTASDICERLVTAQPWLDKSGNSDA